MIEECINQKLNRNLKFFRKVVAASTNVVDYKVRRSLFYYF